MSDFLIGALAVWGGVSLFCCGLLAMAFLACRFPRTANRVADFFFGR